MLYYVDIWSALMDVAVHAYRIKDMPLDSLKEDQSSVFFILTNTLNNILEAIDRSS